jgi:ribosome-associated protein
VNLDIRKLQTIIVEALDDIKARDIVVFDTTGGTQEFDRVIVATADVARQTRAVAMNVVDKVKQAGGRITGMEGGNTGDWVLVDCGDAVVHIMQPAMRQYYNLEELWGQKQVRVLTAADKAAAVARRVVAKAGELADKTIQAAQAVVKKAAGKKAVAKKAPAKQAAVKKAVTKKAAAKKTEPKKAMAKAPAVKKAVAKKAVVKKTLAKKVVAKAVATKAVAKQAPAKKAVTKKTAIKKVTVKKPVAKMAAVKKAAASKATSRKPVAKKAAAKKSAAKKAAKAPVKAAKKAAKKPG